MIYIIENDKLKIKISSMGAELQSIRRIEDDTEYLWQGDPTYWAGRAANLFPICGRLFTGKYTFEGNTYEMNLHGFARHQEFEVIRQDTAAITLRLTENAETLAIYPFRFTFDIAYTLSGEDLSIALIVRNLDDKTMYFAVGGHPGFNLPLEEGKAFEDYFVEFDEACDAKRICFSDTCFYVEKAEPFALEDGKVLHMRHDLFDRDAIFLQDTAKTVTLQCEGGKRAVRVSYPDMPYVGLWHAPKTDAPYVCIEPWTGLPSVDGKVDDLATKTPMHTLEPQEVYRNVYKISFL
ncbi:MAG: aldose 1-epimerase family protein [Clostridia bacterium]|nr:aldose 1-epimerase family protein [Clostridia bacterium]